MTMIIIIIMIMMIIIVIAMFIILSIHVDSVDHDEVWIVDRYGRLRADGWSAGTRRSRVAIFPRVLFIYWSRANVTFHKKNRRKFRGA